MKKNFYKSALASKNRILKLYTLNSDTSLNRSIQFYQKNLPLFYEWLAGFIDGEGNFQINPLKGKSGEIVKFSFMFNINLHVDDVDVLHSIAKILGIGFVTLNTTNPGKYVCSAYCWINKQSELSKLIDILNSSPLNGVKYLDFLDFSKAYDLYFNRPSRSITPDVIEEVLKLKNGMNRQRNNFNRPIPINITDYGLLGLIEGEGSFHLIRSRLVPIFAIKMVSDQ